MHKVVTGFFAGLGVWLLLSVGANAATVQTYVTGTFETVVATGITGLVVGGTTYDVDFTTSTNLPELSTQLLAAEAAAAIASLFNTEPVANNPNPVGRVSSDGTNSSFTTGVFITSSDRDDRVYTVSNPTANTIGPADPWESFERNPASAGATYAVFTPSPVPLPAAAWLFGSALLGLVTLKRRNIST